MEHGERGTEGAPAPVAARKRRTKEEIAADKLAKQCKRDQLSAERQAKRDARQQEQERKSAERAAKRAIQPQECLQHLRVDVEAGLGEQPDCGPALLATLGSVSGLTVRCAPLSEALPVAGAVAWFRHVAADEWQLEEQLLVVLPACDFVHHIQDQSLVPFIRDLQRSGGEQPRRLSLVVFNVEALFQRQKAAENKAFKNHVLGLNAATAAAPARKKKVAAALSITKVQVEEAALAAQLQCGVTLHFLRTDTELAGFVHRCTKAVGQRLLRESRADNFFSFQVQVSKSTKVAESGAGVGKLWRQQLMQMGRGVSAEMVQPILEQFPTPRSLVERYDQCSEREALGLLADLTVVRGAGVLSTSRRVGKELSRRVYQILSADDGQAVIA